MNDATVTTIIIILILLLIVYFVFLIPTKPTVTQGFEPFTNDEAIQNIASLYNTGNMTVTNLNATSSVTTPNLKVNGTMTANSVSDTSMNGTIKAYIDSKINALQTQTNALTRQTNAIIIRASKYSDDGYHYVPLIKAGGYFNSSQPDGYTLRFVFVHPTNDNSTTNNDYWFGIAMKIGLQFFLWKYEPVHTNVPYPYLSSNQANWPQFRGNY